MKVTLVLLFACLALDNCCVALLPFQVYGLPSDVLANDPHDDLGPPETKTWKSYYNGAWKESVQYDSEKGGSYQGDSKVDLGYASPNDQFATDFGAHVEKNPQGEISSDLRGHWWDPESRHDFKFGRGGLQYHNVRPAGGRRELLDHITSKFEQTKNSIKKSRHDLF